MRGKWLVKRVTNSGYRWVAPFIHALQDKQHVHFLHIGKTGGTALRSVLKHYPKTDHFIIQIHHHQTTLRDVPKRDQVMFFLRDPVKRFVSGFYSRQRQGQPTHFMAWTPDETVAFALFDTPKKLALALSSQNEAIRASAENAMHAIYHVKSSYWDWFENEAYFRSRLSDIFFVGFQERLSEDFERLRVKLGLPDHVKLPDDDVRAHRSPAYLDTSLDDSALENLRQWYKQDYHFIELCQESFNLQE